VTNAAPAAGGEERDRPAPEGEERVDVKVVTFETGAVDVSEDYRGHTALVVGGYTYSFGSNGWSCGQTEAEYRRQNEYRTATVQVPGRTLVIPDPGEVSSVRRR